MKSSNNRECGRKHKHSSKEAAIRHRTYLIIKGAFSGRIHVYKCSVCEAFHVGHMKQYRGQK